MLALRTRAVTGRRGDILIEPPLARHADVVPAVEDRSYVVFIGGALLAAVAGGFTLAIAVSLSGADVAWAGRYPWLAQAHGWSQLMGWAGLFVAGMGFRLLPRFAGRPPAPRPLMLAAFALLFTGLVTRTIGQIAAGDGLPGSVLFAGMLLWAAGAAVFAVTIGVTVVRGRSRGRGEPWSLFALAGATCWLAWAGASLAAGWRARETGLVPAPFDEPMTWFAMLGAIGNFIWAVQSRSVPVFFGRPTPSVRRILAPFILLNGGVALAFAGLWIDDGRFHARVLGAAWLTAGVALAWLAPVAGSCWGRAVRLRPRARASVRFVVAANVAAVVTGVLLAWAGARTLDAGVLAAPAARDAARHAFGTGVITLLIVGMAQMVAPFFAIRRVESGVGRADHLLLVLLLGAAVLRVAAGLLRDPLSTGARMHLGAAAGVMALAGLVLFAGLVARAVRNEPRIRAAVAEAARGGGARGPGAR